MLSDIINDHAPLKCKRKPAKPLPFMNSKLRKEIHRKAMFSNKYFKMGRSRTLWEQYRRSRNLVTKLKTKSTNEYFDKKCNTSNGNKSSKEFWNTIKPFISHRPSSGDSCFTVLDDSDNLISKPDKVCESFNNFFSNIACGIGLNDNLSDYCSIDDINNTYNAHPSITAIRNHNNDLRTFDFSYVEEECVLKLMKTLDTTKAVGFDNIPSKLLKAAGDELSKPFTYLINKTISKSCFPSELKKAEVSPIFKAKDALQRGNYRPVSILTSISKLIERIYFNDLYSYFDSIFSVYISAFRKHYGCQHVLTRLLVDCKAALDRREQVGLVLVDLSKAFDCIPHPLLLSKLSNYGLSINACNLMWSYLSGRMQRVKMGNIKSTWQCINKGVPQGSILGPLLFNIFLNDLFYIMGSDCNLYNFADDNTIGKWNFDIYTLKSQLETECEKTLSWFTSNGMSSNASKLNALILKSAHQCDNISILIDGTSIPIVSSAKLLGVTIDERLNFDEHVNTICKKASRQINAIARIAKFLKTETLRMLYTAFINSNFLYCANVWHFGLRSNFWKLERVNKRALRIITNDYTSSYPELLEKARCNCIYVQNVHVILVECFKYINEINPNILLNVFNFRNHNYNTRGLQRLQLPQASTEKHGINSFRFIAPRLWNSLPDDMKLASDVNDFKFKIKKWKPQCSCGNCILCKLHLV